MVLEESLITRCYYSSNCIRFSMWVFEVKIIDAKDKPIAIMPIDYINEEPEITKRRKIEEFAVYR